MEPGQLEALVATYGPDTWRIYDHLDVSLDPTGPDELFDIAADLIRPGDVVLDAGCRDASHLIELCRRHEINGIGVDPAPAHVEGATVAVTAAGLTSRVTLHQAMLEEAPVASGSVDLVWCRDVLEQVADLPSVLRGAARVLRPGGAMVVFTVVDNGLTDADRELLTHHRGVVTANLDPARLMAAYAAAGLLLEETIEIGTRWREYAEERTRPVSRKLLQLARLRRQRAQLTTTYGADALAHVEANLHWELWQFLGLTLPVVHVLWRERYPD
ncbi:class I SAM-dependent methyltransferase [Nocardioides sp. InS609-2]|uniref:class I SAM-dependent methyltransferase n=1 Tax=Nocardioides sp. InS609-2 TaxID=2760705 RepID=UPI0020BED470|nr:class I SAM-dependent methyltransferase [Nocardioides sp. InS609-2]